MHQIVVLEQRSRGRGQRAELEAWVMTQAPDRSRTFASTEFVSSDELQYYTVPVVGIALVKLHRRKHRHPEYAQGL